jgi:hypothetical protein
MTTPDDDKRTEAARWHWGEGHKYVIEGGKTLILINAGAPTFILTFNEKLRSLNIPNNALLLSLLLFSFGVIFGSFDVCFRLRSSIPIW